MQSLSLYLSAKLTSSMGSSSKSAGSLPEASEIPACPSPSSELFSNISGWSFGRLFSILSGMAISGIAPFCTVLALKGRVERSGLDGSNLEKDLESCSG